MLICFVGISRKTLMKGIGVRAGAAREVDDHDGDDVTSSTTSATAVRKTKNSLI